MTSSLFSRRLFSAAIVSGLAAALATTSPLAASADTIIDGPINLGTALSYGVLGASSVTSTGPTVVNGDLGISPGTSVTGFGGLPNGTINGNLNQTNGPALIAQDDADTAYNIAAGLTPQSSGFDELAGRSLTPGVYRGGEMQLSNNGLLTLAGTAKSVWVFQAESLTVGSNTQVIITGGASACNVFWQVSSSASIGTDARFQGTVMAQQSITVTARASIVGRLLALNAAVTLDTNLITAATGCPPPGTPSETVAPEITSESPANPTAGTPYSHTVEATGNPAPTYTVTDGALPAGLALDSATGTISGTPTTPGDSTFTVRASNGEAPDDFETYTVTTQPAPPAGTPGIPNSPSTATGSGSGPGGGTLANTGTDLPAPLIVTALALLVGSGLLTAAIRRRRTESSTALPPRHG